MKKIFAVLCLCAVSLFFAAPTLAEAPEDEASSSALSDPVRQELKAAFQAATSVLQKGPSAIPLAGQATLDLPEGYGFIPPREARRLMKAMGNGEHNSLLGMVVPLDGENANWFVAVNYQAAGYIKDDDAKNWDAAELLDNIRSGTEESNEERKARGIPEMEIVGWIEKPQYDQSTRHLVWSIQSRDKGQGADSVNGVNYNTLALGREGFISMNLVADTASIEDLKPKARDLLAGLSFDAGKRYSDFNESTDKTAEYGLAALVAGMAVKKMGLFAVIAAFAVKFAKIIGVAAVAGGGALAKVFSRRKDTDA